MEQELSRAIIDATVDECDVRRPAHAPREVPRPRRIGCRRRMLQPIAVGHKSLADYTHLAGRPLVEEIQELAEDLEGLKVLHLSATAFGGGVSEILYTLVPLMRDVGIEADWQVMLGREEFFNVTKLLHNALQGNPQALTDEEWEIFDALQRAERRRDRRRLGRDHHPRPPAGRRSGATCRTRPRSWIWRCHIDLSTPNADAVEHMVPLVRELRRQRSSTSRTTCRPGMDGERRRCASARRRSTRCRPRTWRSRPRTPPSCATSSASTWTGR